MTRSAVESCPTLLSHHPFCSTVSHVSGHCLTFTISVNSRLRPQNLAGVNLTIGYGASAPLSSSFSILWQRFPRRIRQVPLRSFFECERKCRVNRSMLVSGGSSGASLKQTIQSSLGRLSPYYLVRLWLLLSVPVDDQRSEAPSNYRWRPWGIGPHYMSQGFCKQPRLSKFPSKLFLK